MKNSGFSLRVFDVSWNTSQAPSRGGLFPHSPTCLFCYWTVDDTRRQLLAEHFGRGYETLAHRLQLVRLQKPEDRDGDVVQDWDVPISADTWYFRDVQPAQVYGARLVTFTADGAPFTVLRTNIAATPPAQDAVHSGHAPRKPLHQRNDLHSAHTSPERSLLFIHEGEHPNQSAGTDYPYMNEFDGYSITPSGGRTDG